VPWDEKWHDLTLKGWIIHVGTQQRGRVDIWVVERDENPPIVHHLRVFLTGEELPDSSFAVLGTAITLGGAVYHLVEKYPPNETAPTLPPPPPHLTEYAKETT
jgi:hypothetical protein